MVDVLLSTITISNVKLQGVQDLVVDVVGVFDFYCLVKVRLLVAPFLLRHFNQILLVSYKYNLTFVLILNLT